MKSKPASDILGISDQPMSNTLRIHFFTLTDTHASEHVYMASLRDALTERDIVPVDDWYEADIVHLFEVNFYSRAALEEFEYPKLFRILRSDTPVIVSTDDLYFIDRPELTARPSLYPVNHRTQRWLFSQCDAIVAISESVRETLTEYLDPRFVDVVRHGIEDQYRSDVSTDGEPFVLHVSIAAKRKNPSAIVELAQKINSRFVVVGSGWDEHFDGIPNTDNVDVRGYVPEDDLVKLYHDADVFYFPTLHEGFGLPVLEAMAAGCAVVTSDVYSVPEVAGDAAILHDPNDVSAHVDVVRYLLNDEDERRAWGKKARDRAMEFTWKKAAEETKSVYRSVLSE